MYVVCFNGPPESGKDTAAMLLAQLIEAKHDITVREDSLSYPLRRLAYCMVGNERMRLDGEDYAKFKTTLYPGFGYGRQIMIDISEKFLKPVYGKTVMANMLLSSLMRFNGIVLIRDCGFQCELDPLFNAFGTQNVYVVRVHRPGKTFENDSREWVNHHDTGMSMELDNSSDLFNLSTEVGRIYSRLLNQLGWKL